MFKIHSRLSHDAADGQIKDKAEPFVIWSKNGPVKLMHPHDPKAPAAETINCGCVALPFMDSWDVATPGRKAYSDEEIRLNPMKRDMAQGKTVTQALEGLAQAKSAKLTAMGSDAYKAAKAGSRQAGLLKQLPNYGPNQLRKALASQRVRAQEHLEKIANPARYCEGWAERTPQYREGLLRKWRSEVADADEQIAVIEGYRNEQE